MFKALVLSLSLCAHLVATEVVAQTPSPATAGDAAVASTLMQMERDWCTALTTRNPAVLEPILADDYSSVNSRGVIATKTTELADVKAGASGFATCVHDNMKVRVFGDAAVITGHNVTSGRFKDVPFTDRGSYWTDTYVRRNNRWQCVASHSSPAVMTP